MPLVDGLLCARDLPDVRDLLDEPRERARDLLDEPPERAWDLV